MLSYLACSHHCPFEERTPHNHINASWATAHLNASMLKLEFFRFLGEPSEFYFGITKCWKLQFQPERALTNHFSNALSIPEGPKSNLAWQCIFDTKPTLTQWWTNIFKVDFGLKSYTIPKHNTVFTFLDSEWIAHPATLRVHIEVTQAQVVYSWVSNSRVGFNMRVGLKWPF